MIGKKPTIKPYNHKELAGLYEMTPRCFTTQIRPIRGKIGLKIGRYFNIKQVAMIFNHLGYPNSMLSDELELVIKDEVIKKIKCPED